jgi:hypothetical protein
MAKLRRDVKPLLSRAIESLTLAIEVFNRPSETGRGHAVPILLHHAFEMLLKAAILQSGRSIHDKEARFTISFDRCLAEAEDLGLLNSDGRAALSILDAHRDSATHFYAEVSEDVLYVLAQSAVTLFDRTLRAFRQEGLAEHMPSRVLPVSVRPPRDLDLLLHAELTEVDGLLCKGKRKGAAAAAKLRSILAFATASRARAERVSEDELERAIAKRRKGTEWSVILPEVAFLRLSTEGDGIPITMKLVKHGEIPVRLARPGVPVEGVVVKQEINPFDKYNLNLDSLAKNVGLTSPKALAVIAELGIQNDPKCFRILKVGRQAWKRYSVKALNMVRTALDNGLDVAATWKKHRSRFTNAAA